MSSTLTISRSYLFFTTTIFITARTFTEAFIAEGSNVTLANVRVAENALSFLNGFVDGDLTLTKRVVKRSVENVPVKPKVPQYMLDLYERLETKKLRVKFDIVRSFRCEGISKIKEHKKSITSNSYKLVFNISNFLHSEYALLTQLRIQSVQPSGGRWFGSAKIDTFSLLENPPTLLSSKAFNPKTESLYTVDITKTLQKALYSNKKQLFVGLSIPKGCEEFLMTDPWSTEGPQLLIMSKIATQQQIHEDKIFSRIKRSLDEYNAMPTNGNLSRTVVDEKFPMNLRSNSREAPNHPNEQEDKEMTEKQSSYIVEELGRTKKRKLRKKKNSCRRKPLLVNFAAINYNWIVAPPSYEAFKCTGRCSVPMNVPFSRHAVIQTLMHGLEPKQVSRACCVPIKLTPISILYVDDAGVFTYKYEYEDMVVSECGCR